MRKKSNWSLSCKDKNRLKWEKYICLRGFPQGSLQSERKYGEHGSR